MNLSTLLLAMPVFWIVYQGVGLLLEGRKTHKWGPAPVAARANSAQKYVRDFMNLSAKLGFNKVLLRSSKLKGRMDMLLLRSGHPYGWKAEDLLFCKEITAVFGLLLAFRIGATNPMAWVFVFGIGFWLPDLYMKAKGTARLASIQRLLPGFIDLTALTLESGLDLLAAIDRILEKMRSSGLKDELVTLVQENRLGTPRKEALQNLAYRVNLPDLQSLTSIIIQSEELGTSLASVLRNYAEDMRNRRILRAEEMAGKMPVKLLFPMMVFFFPIVFVIIFGPLAMNFMSVYK